MMNHIDTGEASILIKLYTMHFFFHFSTPLHRPTIFSAFDFTAKATPNKEWKLESKWETDQSGIRVETRIDKSREI